MKVFPIDSLITSTGPDGIPVYDRPFASADLRTVFKTFFSNGVFMTGTDSLRVTASSGMNVRVGAGICHINGAFGYEKEPRSLVVSASDSSMDRISTVVARLNLNVNSRSCELYVKDGVPARKPIAPTLQRDSVVYELGLANIFVSAGSATISRQRISDTRLDESRCGAVAPFVPIDTTGLYEQLQDQVTSNINLIQSALDETTAGHLQNQLNVTNQGLDAVNLKIADLEKAEVLWSDKIGLFPVASYRANLSKKLSETTHGIVLHWEGFINNAASNSLHNYFFVPKTHAGKGPGVSMLLSDNSGDRIAVKYLYIYDDHVSGHDVNSKKDYKSGSGILMKPRSFALTEILGV